MRQFTSSGGLVEQIKLAPIQQSQRLVRGWATKNIQQAFVHGVHETKWVVLVGLDHDYRYNSPFPASRP